MIKKHNWMAIVLPLLVIVCACVFSQRTTPAPGAEASPATATQAGTPGSCQANYGIGFRIVHFNGIKAGVWYPSSSPQEAFNYSKDINTSLAKDGDPQLGCGTFPLVIFSHGLDGCGAQSIFFTETLARSGYIVVAPDHQDALLCSVDGTGQTFERATEPAIMDPKTWDETSYKYRKDEIEAVLDGALADSQLKTMINAEQIGIAGHSLGGYTALAMAGGWPGWKDSRFKAALLMSPYSLPFSIKNTLKDVTIPVMYQGAQGDVGITPFVEGSRGAYANSNPPKYFMKLHGGNHFTWTNAVCAGSPLISDCLQSKADAKLIDDFGIAFFETFLKGKTEPLLTSGDGSLMAFMHQP